MSLSSLLKIIEVAHAFLFLGFIICLAKVPFLVVLFCILHKAFRIHREMIELIVQMACLQNGLHIPSRSPFWTPGLS